MSRKKDIVVVEKICFGEKGDVAPLFSSLEPIAFLGSRCPCTTTCVVLNLPWQLNRVTISVNYLIYNDIKVYIMHYIRQ